MNENPFKVGKASYPFVCKFVRSFHKQQYLKFTAMVESCKRNTLNFVLSASIIQSEWLYRDLHKIINVVAPISKIISAKSACFFDIDSISKLQPPYDILIRNFITKMSLPWCGISLMEKLFKHTSEIFKFRKRRRCCIQKINRIE